jgi:hypothetical protein
MPDKGRPVAVRTLEFESHKLPVAVSAEDPASDVLDEEEFPFANTLQCVPGLQVLGIHATAVSSPVGHAEHIGVSSKGLGQLRNLGLPIPTSRLLS